MAEKKKNGKSSGLTVACVVLAILVILIIILVKKDTIVTNLKDTQFFDRVFGKTPEFVQNYESQNPRAEIPMEEEGTVTIKVETEKRPPSEESEPVLSPKSETAQIVEQPLPQPEAPKTAASEQDTAQGVQKQDAPAKPKDTVTTQVTYTELQLCFVEIDSDGSVNRKLVKRSIPKNDSPLTTAIKLLLEGPDSTKAAERNCMTLIPGGTKLLSARVQNGVAYLNFNDKFEFNSEGTVGQINQLMQIVYTATNFSTVSGVQFLIEGQQKKFLGEEGIRIDTPLSRNSF